MRIDNGITLIALIITIIVMLILAGVTISTFTGDGSIIENAETAVGEYNNKVINEQETLNEVIKYIKNDGNVDIEESGISISATVDTTGVTKKVIVTVVGKADDGIKSFTSTAGDSKTYASGTKEIEETCEITENGIYLFTIEDNNGKTASKGILIENILEGTIQIKADKTMPTKDNVIVTVTWPNGSESGRKEIKVGNNSWQVASGNTSEVEVTENCTVKARVSNSEGEVTQASITISNIDKLAPIVSVASGTETITEGDSKEISSYFTYSQNGTAEITSVKYTDTSDGNKEVTNTNTLAEGTHIIKCTVTKETGLSSSATKAIIVEKGGLSAIDIANAASEHFGGYVTNYTTPSGDPNVKWRIFYADEENVYLIADDYIHYNYAPTGRKGTPLYKNTDYELSFDNVYQDYTGASDITDERITKWISCVKDNKNEIGAGIQSIAFMLDELRWSAKYANTTYAEYAVGGSTLELWCASYKATHDRYIEATYDSIGYTVKWSDSTGSPSYSVSGADDYKDLYYIKSSTSKASYMWLASLTRFTADRLIIVDHSGYVWHLNYNSAKYYSVGVRPLVCLKSDIQLEKQSDGTYLIK